jgi:hypothetical protein
MAVQVAAASQCVSARDVTDVAIVRPPYQRAMPRAQAHKRLSQRFHGLSMAKERQDVVKNAVKIRLTLALQNQVLLVEIVKVLSPF